MNQVIPTTAVDATHDITQPWRSLQWAFTILALLAFAGGSLLLSLGWLGIGLHTTGKVVGAEEEARAFLMILILPITMLSVWICSTIALLVARRWVLASLSLPVAIAILYGLWWFIAFFMLNISGVAFAALFVMLNTGAIWLAVWFLISKKRIKIVR
jgi:hypothetical protein